MDNRMDMDDLHALANTLKGLGYGAHVFALKEDAATWLNGEIDGATVGFGGSATLKDMKLYDRLSAHNTVYWHWEQDPDTARKKAMDTDVYISSVNALAKTGELINIDGAGNRVSSTLFGHQRLYLVVGQNKVAPTYEQALWRARNIAAPLRAKQMGRKTPCAVKADKCYDCDSPERICRGLVTLWRPMLGMKVDVLLIQEDLGN